MGEIDTLLTLLVVFDVFLKVVWERKCQFYLILFALFFLFRS